jgi:hypothetical protein
MLSELANRTRVDFSRPRRQPAQVHVFDHALSQLGHGNPFPGLVTALVPGQDRSIDESLLANGALQAPEALHPASRRRRLEFNNSMQRTALRAAADAER